MWLQTRMFLLVAVLFGILYGVIVGIGTWMGTGSTVTYIIIGVAFLGFQYLISPAIVGWTMKVKWVSEKEAPDKRFCLRSNPRGRASLRYAGHTEAVEQR